MSDTATPAEVFTRAMMDAYKAAVAPHLEPGAPYALVDFPDHPNVGDSAIYTGELEFLDAHAQRPPSYVCGTRYYRGDLAQFCPEGPILIHGGGNFGDVWRGHQLFRERILREYPDRKVVQLAQSIHFSDPARRDDAARVIDAHPDFTLLVRDRESFDLASRHFDCAVQMCPDAAHNMWHLPPTKPPSYPILSVLRRDHEGQGDEILPYMRGLGPVEDWDRHFWARSLSDRVIERIISPRLPPNALLMRHRERMYRRQAWNRVHHGVAILQRGALLVSDRLHVHLLAGLMRRPHITMDNFYGKISRYIDAWGEDGLVVRVQDLDGLKAALAKHQQD